MLLRCERLKPPMSQLGSNSVVPVMSAARPLFPRNRTSIRDLAMSHSCHNRTNAPQQTADHSITSSCEREQRRRHFEAERLGGLEVQKQFRFTRPRDGRVPNAL
jgi:hypothetical protein